MIYRTQFSFYCMKKDETRQKEKKTFVSLVKIKLKFSTVN